MHIYLCPSRRQRGGYEEQSCASGPWWRPAGFFVSNAHKQNSLFLIYLFFELGYLET